MFDHDHPQAGAGAPQGAAPSRGGAAAAGIADLGHIANKWKWEFLGVLLAVLLGALGYIALIRAPLFESEARLFVRVSTEQVPPGTIRSREGVTFMPSARSDVLSEIDLLLTGELMLRVIDNARLEELAMMPPPPPATAMQALRRRLSEPFDRLRDQFDEVLILLGLRNRLSLRESLQTQLERSIVVENTRDSNVIVVGIRWRDRAVPQPLLQHYIDAFLDFRLGVSDTGEVDYFAAELAAATAEIDRVTAVRQGLRDAGVHALHEQRVALIGQMSGAEADLDAIAAQLQVSATRLSALRAAADEGWAGGADGLTLANMPEHPLLSNLDGLAISLATQIERAAARGQLSVAEGRALQREFALVRQATLETLAEHVDTLEIRRAAEATRIAGLQAQLADLAALEADWRASERDLEAAERNQRHFAERLDEARGLEALRDQRIGNVIVLQQPSEARFATTVRNTRLLVVFGVFGVFLALIWVSVREVFDRRLYRPEDVEALTGRAPLAVLPPGAAAMAAPLAIAATRLRFLLAPPAGAAPPGLEGAVLAPPVPAAVVIAPLEAGSPRFADEVRTLALGLRRQEAGRVLVINLGAWRPTRDEAAETIGDDPAARLNLPDLGRLGRDAAGVHHLGFFGDAHAERFLERLERAPRHLLDGWDVVLVATAPLNGAPLALRATLALRQLLVRVRAGRDRGDRLTGLLKGLDEGGVRLVGTVLAQ